MPLNLEKKFLKILPFGLKFEKFCTIPRRMLLHKLNTHHDYYYAHKLLAIICVMHFFICLTPLYNHWKQSVSITIQTCFVFLHFLLGCSSFIFMIPKNRTSMYTIFRELQLHNLLFTLRSIGIWCLLTFSPENKKSNYLNLRFGFIVLIHLLVDLTTYMFAPERGETLIRRMTKEKENKKSNFENSNSNSKSKTDQLGNYFASISQLGATWSCLCGIHPRTQIAILLGIQMGAFGATLVRKGILTSFQGAIFYLGSLFVAWWIKCLETNFVIDFIGISLVALFRFHFSINKYFLWGCVFLLLKVDSTSGHYIR